MRAVGFNPPTTGPELRTVAPDDPQSIDQQAQESVSDELTTADKAVLVGLAVVVIGLVLLYLGSKNAAE